MNHLVDWREHTGANLEKFYKTTLWESERVMIGLNCLEPNQTQAVHAHQGAEKIYFVLEGRGTFTVGDETREASSGMLIVAPSGVPHGVTNTGPDRLSLLIAMAPRSK